MERTSSQDLKSSVFTPLLISASGIIATTIAILVYHLVVVRFCLTRARIREVIDGPRPITNQSKKGLDKAILNKIPVCCYSTKPGQVTFRVDQTECVVCLGELEENVSVRVLPNCSHAFHVECIDEWLSFHTTCPVCRSPVYPIQVSHVSLTIEDGGECEERAERRRFVMQEKKPQRLITGLKRSLSVDQSHVLINVIHRKNNDNYGIIIINNYNNNNNNKASSSMLKRSYSQI